jgi:hypothetical protein
MCVDCACCLVWRRRVIAETVAGDPEEYSEAFLGKPNQEYCRWIQDSQKWGGAIELSILARPALPSLWCI